MWHAARAAASSVRGGACHGKLCWVARHMPTLRCASQEPPLAGGRMCADRVVQPAFSRRNPSQIGRREAAVGVIGSDTMPASVRSVLQGPLLQGRVARAVLAGAAALLALPALEIGYRLQSHRPALALEDWRAGRI